jgi:hypothetical protein
MTTAGLCVNDIFPSFWRHQRRLMADIMMLEHDGYIPCVSSWARRGAEMDWIHLPQPVPAARASSKLADLFVPVLLECELAKIEIACKRVSYCLFKTGLYLLGRNSYFRDLPFEILRHIHDMGNAQPTAAAHFERAVYTVASDGVLFAQYLSVDLRRLNTPRPFNAGRYTDEYPTTEEESDSDADE